MQRTVEHPQDFGRVLSSMCTSPHPVAQNAAQRFQATNPGDPETYKAVSDLETRTVEALGHVVGLDGANGYVTSGGTEANIQAVRSARDRLDVDEPNVVGGEHLHFSFHKAADLLGVELRTVPLTEDRITDLDAVAAAVDENTVLVVGVAGSTEYGRVDPIPALATLATEVGAFVHVDAAWGGFVLPFTEYDWNFSDAPIDTLTIDLTSSVRQSFPPVDSLRVSRLPLTYSRSTHRISNHPPKLPSLVPDPARESRVRRLHLQNCGQTSTAPSTGGRWPTLSG